MKAAAVRFLVGLALAGLAHLGIHQSPELHALLSGLAEQMVELVILLAPLLYHEVQKRRAPKVAP